MSSSSVISTVFYASPYGTLPPGVNTAGVTVQANSSEIPSGMTDPILVIRLRLTTSPEVIGVSPTSGMGTSSTTAIYQPDFPLSATEPYMVDLIWVESGTPPGNIDWNSAVANAPVTVAEVFIKSASYDGTNLTVSFTYGASGIGVGAQVNVYALSSGTYVKLGSTQTEGAETSFTFTNPGYPDAYYVSVQSAIPANNLGGAGNFAAPFSLGPVSNLNAYTGIPQAAKTITKAEYDGHNLVVNWDLDTVDGCADPTASLVEILANDKVVASYIGGSNSANFPIDVLNQSSVKVQVRTVSNNLSSAPISLDLITEPPTVTDVFGDKAGGTVTAKVSTVPSGPNIQAYLMDGDIQLAGPSSLSGGEVSFDYSTADYNVDGMVGVSVVAWAVSSDSVVSGPESSRSVLLATTPSLISGTVQTDPDDDTKWKVDLLWDRLPDAASDIASYTASIFQETTSVSTQTLADTTTSLSFAKTQIDTAKDQTIQLYATGSSGGNSPTLSLSLLFTAPLLASLVTSSNQIGATWAAPTIPAANTLPVQYQMVIAKSDGTTLYTGSSTSGTQAAISLADFMLTGSDTPLVLVNIAIGPVTTLADAGMNTKCSATPILTAPVIDAVTANALNNKSTLHWESASGTATYDINFTDGTSHTGATTNSYTLSSALTADSMLGFSVITNDVSNQVPVTGPPSSIIYIPTNTANVEQIRFNGTTVEMSWSTVSGAKNYNVLVYDNAGTPTKTYSGNTTETSSSFSVTVDATKVYTAYIQPVMENGAGLAGTSMQLFSPAVFLSKEPASTAYPYAYVGSDMSMLGSDSAGPTATQIVLYLPELGSTSGALGTTPITVAPFTIEPSGNTDLPYKLTIDADATVWTFDTNDIRATLQSDYVDFLKAVETPPAGGTGVTGATPYGLSLLQSAIGRYMPQTFAELLYYNFGFSTTSDVGAGYVDLKPGMILRATISSYINIPEYNLPSWMLGYAGSTVFDFEIGSYNSGGNWRVGFDGFLNTLASQGALNVSVPASGTGTQAGLAGAVDLYYPQFVQPYYRLYLPDNVQTPWTSGSNSPGSNFTLVAASSYSNLQTTTVDPNTNSTAYFRGRSTLEVLIKVTINGTENIVPIGTSIGNLLEQRNLRPAANSKIFKTLRVYRSIEPAMTDTNADNAQGPLLEIKFDWDGFTSYSTGNGLDILSLPLLPGDQILFSDTDQI